MKPVLIGFRMLLLASWLVTPAARAFPPAPDGVIYGIVKDQYGTPLMNTADLIVLQTPSGVQVVAPVQPDLAVGVNYAIRVPMDAGTLPTPYVSNALTATTSYKLYVVVSGATNLPIEMTGAYSVLGTPSQMAQQNLTLGTDSNGDGIPDAWESLFLQEIGLNIPLSQLNTNIDYAHDGRTLLQEYLLGNYPYNPTNQFAVTIVTQNAGSVVLAFTTMTGRTYTPLGSSDLKTWTPLSFIVPSAGATIQSSYYATNIQPVRIQTVAPPSAPTFQFFRLQLQ